MRSRAKAVNFGIVYGIGDFSLAKDLKISRKARAYIDGYLDRYPNVKKYMHDIVEEGKEKGFRYLPELKSRNFNIRSFGERVAMNTPIQGSAAEVHGELKKNEEGMQNAVSLKVPLVVEIKSGSNWYETK